MKIELYGASFSLESDESHEHLQRIIRYLKEKEQQIIKLSPPLTDPLKKAILASFLTANELLKLKDSHNTEQTKLMDTTLVLTEKMIQQLDQSMYSPIE